METKIEKLFSLLDNWRKLPAYQLERRADIFFALYLPEIFKHKFAIKIDYKQIIPEFPIKMESKNLSNKIDYVVVSKENKTVYLIELKTEMTSVITPQIELMKRAQGKGTKGLIKSVEQIAKVSKSEKYKELESRLETTGMTDKKIIWEEPKIVYLLPKPNEKLKDFTQITFKEIAGILKEKDELAKRFVESLEVWIK